MGLSKKPTTRRGRLEYREEEGYGAYLETRGELLWLNQDDVAALLADARPFTVAAESKGALERSFVRRLQRKELPRTRLKNIKALVEWARSHGEVVAIEDLIRSPGQASAPGRDPFTERVKAHRLAEKIERRLAKMGVASEDVVDLRPLLVALLSYDTWAGALYTGAEITSAWDSARGRTIKRTTLDLLERRRNRFARDLAAALDVLIESLFDKHDAREIDRRAASALYSKLVSLIRLANSVPAERFSEENPGVIRQIESRIEGWGRPSRGTGATRRRETTAQRKKPLDKPLPTSCGVRGVPPV